MEEGDMGDDHELGLVDLSDDTLTSVLVVLASSRSQLRNAALSCKRLLAISSRPEVVMTWLQMNHSRLNHKFLRAFLKRISAENHLSLTKMLVSEACSGEKFAGFDWETFALISVELGFTTSACLLYTTPAEPIAEPTSDEENSMHATRPRIVRSSSGRSAVSIARVSSSRRPTFLNRASNSNPVASSLVSSSYRAGAVHLAMPSMKIITRNSRDQGGAGPSTTSRVPLDRPSLSSSQLFVALENDALSHVPKFQDPSKIKEEEEEEEEEEEKGEALTLAHVGFLDNAAIRAACSRGCLDSIVALAALGADLGSPDGLPLALAAGGGHVSFVRWLIDQGVDVNLGNARALHAAIASDDKNQLEILSMLLANGADVHRSDDFALRWACAHGRIHVVRILLSNGADVQAAKNDALYQAAKNGHFHVVKLLLKQGADPIEAKDAIKRAAGQGHKQVADLLQREVSRGKITRMVRKKVANLFSCLAP